MKVIDISDKRSAYMNVDFTWITNYKSIQNRNKLKVNKSVTTVIGKNESGKSNPIDILGLISLRHSLTDDTYKKTPQGIDDAKMLIEIECSFTETEIDLLELKSNNKKSIFYISQEYTSFNVAISGALQDYFNKLTTHSCNF